MLGTIQVTRHTSPDGLSIHTMSIPGKKLHPNAEEPFKEVHSDVGYEISVVGREDNRVEDIYGDVNVFTTGLVLRAPKNYHFELLEHPQLYKTGYSLAGAPRIINPGDESEILLPLYKFKESEDLELPFRAAILVLRQTEYALIRLERSGSSNNNVQIQFDDEDDIPAPRSRQQGGRRKGNGKTNHMF